jgi:hypothetical protein
VGIVQRDEHVGVAGPDEAVGAAGIAVTPDIEPMSLIPRSTVSVVPAGPSKRPVTPLLLKRMKP